MRSIVGVSTLLLVLLSSPASAGPHCYYGHPHCYYGHGSCVSFGFGFGGFYAPPPVYVVPPPAVYYAPPVVVPPPVFVQPPMVMQEPPMVQPSPDASQPTPEACQPSAGACQTSPPAQQAPTFVETNRRCHQHGDNKGKLDWVEGLLDGRPVRIYYDDFGRVKKQKWVD